MINSKPREHRLVGEGGFEGQVAGHGEADRYIRYRDERPAAGGKG
jgi:hypothetical protein